MVQEKPTDLDAPEPEWKCLSSFAVRKGPTKSSIKGAVGSLLALRWGPARTTLLPSPPDGPGPSAMQQQDIPIIADNTHEMDNQAPTAPAQLAEQQESQPQPEPPFHATQQTRSG